jgi:protein TonB
LNIRIHHWLLALGVAVLLHGVLVLALVRPTPAAPGPSIAIAVELEPPGNGDGSSAQTGEAGDGLAGGPATDLPDEAEDEEGDGQAADPRSSPEPEVVAKPVPQPAPKVVEEPRPKVVASPKPKPKPQTKPRVAQKPMPKPKPKATPRPDAPETPSTRAGSAQSSTRPDTGSGKSASKGGGSGSQSGAQSGGDSGGKPSAGSQQRYYGELARWLARHKRYPPEAKRKRETGTVRVTFTIDRGGRVISRRIVGSSGHRLLDDEVEAMLRRASPMPKIPADFNRATLTVTLPVVFNLR